MIVAIFLGVIAYCVVVLLLGRRFRRYLSRVHTPALPRPARTPVTIDGYTVSNSKAADGPQGPCGCALDLPSCTPMGYCVEPGVGDDMMIIAMPSGLRSHFEAWLASRGFELAAMPEGVSPGFIVFPTLEELAQPGA